MDLALSILLLIIISSIKMLQKPSSVVENSFVDETGVVCTSVVNEEKLVIGTNLMLRRVPRAYHKILDEMGLSQ